MKFCGLRASLILLDRREPEPRQSTRAPMAYVGAVVCGNTKNLAAGCAQYMKDTAAIALPDMVNECASRWGAVEI
jgi:hypothetical protein